MFRLILIAILLGVLSPRPGYGDPDGPSVLSPVVFPTFVKPVKEADPVPTDFVPTIKSGQWYVVASDTEFFLLASPAGIVNITSESGPIKLRGTFVDGTGKVETRSYPQKFLAIVDAIDGKTGRVELIAVPKAVAAESDITRRLIEVGNGPRPPPGPVDPEVDPIVPTPPGPVVPTGFRVIFGYDTMSAATTREKLNSIYSTAITAYLTEHCAKGPKSIPEWRKWSFKVVTTPDESPTLTALWEQSKPLFKSGPQLIIASNGKANVFDVPNTEAETLALLKKYAEGK